MVSTKREMHQVHNNIEKKVWHSKARVLWNGPEKLQYLRVDNIK
jgi:hypothetical protein